MNKATLFAVIFCGFLMSSFHHPQGSSTMASSAPAAAANVVRTISSEKVEAMTSQNEGSKVNKFNSVQHSESLSK